jgi:hypothetical protein
MHFYDLKKQNENTWQQIAEEYDKHLDRWIKALESKSTLNEKEKTDLKWYKKLRGEK